MTKRDKARNAAQIAKGRAKEVAGKQLGNHELELGGQLDQLKGNLKQAGEKVKDALKR